MLPAAAAPPAVKRSTPRIPAPLASLLLAAGCAPIELTGQVAFAQPRVGGRLALGEEAAPGGGVPSPPASGQGIDSAFGLGTAQGVPFLRGQAAFGGPVATASLLWVRDSGEGRLDTSFGGLPAGTTVVTDLDLAVARFGLGYDFDVGPLRVGPGLLADVFALQFRASEVLLGNREEVDDVVLVPLPSLRIGADVGPVRATAELGFLDVPNVGDTRGRFVDIEGLVEWRVLPFGHLFAGYRHIDVDGKGETESRAFAVDLRISGWILGGGLRF